MDRYIISPENCLVLVAVKNSSSLREAARHLNCDPAGLLRKVQRIAQEHGLLQKIHGRWALTSSAEALVAWTQESILSQNKVLRGARVLRIASTTWFAERILIPKLSKLTKTLEDNWQVQLSAPGNGLEPALLEGSCDFIVSCHPPENPMIAHKQIMAEPWSVIVAPQLLSAKKQALSLRDLEGLPFIRHTSTNPNALFPHDLPFHIHFKLSIDNLIGIRAAVQSGLGWSFVPTALVREELANNSLEQVGKRYELDRKICLWWLRGSYESRKSLRSVNTWIREICQNI